MEKPKEKDVLTALNIRKAKILLSGVLQQIKRLGLVPVFREGEKEVCIDIDDNPIEKGNLFFDKS